MARSLSLATRHDFIELLMRKYVKGYGFLSFARNLENIEKNYWIQD